MRLLKQLEMECIGATSVAGVIKKLKQKLKEIRKTRPSSFDKLLTETRRLDGQTE